MSELREAIQQMIRQEIPVTIKRGKVESVDFTTDVCSITPNDGGAIYEDVKLRSITLAPTSTSSRIVTYPKIGTNVLFGIVQNDKNDVFVLEVSEIDSVMIQMNSDMEIHLKNDHTIEVKAPRTSFNGGTFGGMVKLNELVSKLNNLESATNTLKGAMAAWAPASADGIALKALLAVWSANFLTTTLPTMLENPKVRH